MELILTHEKADFDAVASQLGAKKLYPSAVALLSNQLNRNVQQFLNLYWDSLPFLRADEWRRRNVDKVILVDTQSMGNVRGLVTNPAVLVIDHHENQITREGWTYRVESVGSTTALLVEKLQKQGIVLSAEEATLMLIGIYEDTGNLSYDTTTARDVHAAAWMLEQGAQLAVARRFLNMPLSDQQKALYDSLLLHVNWLRIEERSIAIASAEPPPGFDDEISAVTHRLREFLTPDGLFVLVQLGDGVQVVARSSVDEIDVGQVARRLGGGGHPRAAAAMVDGRRISSVADELERILMQVVRPTTRVAALMSHGVQTVVETTTIRDVAELMRRYGHEGYPVTNEDGSRIVGLVTRSAVDRALTHEMDHHPVSRIMRSGSVSVTPSDTIEYLQELMASEGWGQIPVVAERAGDESQSPIGIVTRTDLLNALFKPKPGMRDVKMRQQLADSLSPELWALILVVGETAAEMQMAIYIVGGLVRDLWLHESPTDLDIVIEGDAIHLVQALCRRFGGEVHSHGRFGTAKWSLAAGSREAIRSAAGDVVSAVNDSKPRMAAPDQIDFVSARKEFYKWPTALPDVEPGSIKLDLHRRDFTINTLAIRLDGDHLGQLLDFYGGQRDLRHRLIRVLHSLSFVDDPTRILRAVRLEQRLGFTIEENTASLIDAALPLLDRVSGERIRNEIELSLNEADPKRVMERLDEIGVLQHLHPDLSWHKETAAIFDLIPAYAEDPIWQEIYHSSAPEFFYFAAWLAPLSEPVQRAVAQRLRVRKATLDDLLGLGAVITHLSALDDESPPSAIVQALAPFALRTLLTARALDISPRLNYWLDRYVTEWRLVRPMTSGDDLRRAGLLPGPVYTRILNRLLNARLDGEIDDAGSEHALLGTLLDEIAAPGGPAAN